MTNYFKDIYINNNVVIAGPLLKDGPLKGKFDDTYNDYYDGEKTFEDSEIKELKKSILYILRKEQLKKDDIDFFISCDLTNQLMVSNMVARDINIPYLGVYSACSSFTEELIIASLALSSNYNKVICATSGHSNTSERQFRNPIEYGSPKPDYSTLTVSSATTCILSNEKRGVRIESATIGRVVDLGIKDSFDMGSAMAPAAADTLNRHLLDTGRTVDYYDLILTGDLGVFGKKIFKELCKKEYHYNLNNYNDTATCVYDMSNKKVHAGGSGPSCMPTYLYKEIIPNMINGNIKKVLLLATGALLNTTSVNQKKSIPCVSHAVSLEAI